MGHPINGTTPINGIKQDDNGNSGWSQDTFLGRLQLDERQDLLALSGPTLHPIGEHLLVEGDPGRFLLVLHGGPVKVVVQDSTGREHLLALRGRGDLLGELSYLEHRPRTASVVTLRQMQVTRICAERFSRFLDEHPRVGIELARCISARLRDADRVRLEISTDTVALRVARFLRTLAQQAGSESTHRPTVIPLTQNQLAQLVHAAEVTVNRTLREFKAQNLIRTGYGSIEVPCLRCLDLLLAALSSDQKGDSRTSIGGCGGRHPSDTRPE